VGFGAPCGFARRSRRCLSCWLLGFGCLGRLARLWRFVVGGWFGRLGSRPPVGVVGLLFFGLPVALVASGFFYLRALRLTAH
jgi:hypothetical protein